MESRKSMVWIWMAAAGGLGPTAAEAQHAVDRTEWIKAFKRLTSDQNCFKPQMFGAARGLELL